MASKYIQKFPIPEGFPEILNDLSKEILRYQPEDIVEFSALYFKCLQEGKVLEYSKKGSNIPCDFKNVIPGVKTSEKIKVKDNSDYTLALDKAQKMNINNTNIKKKPSKESNSASNKKNNDNNKNIDIKYNCNKNESNNVKELAGKYVDNILKNSFDQCLKQDD